MTMPLENDDGPGGDQGQPSSITAKRPRKGTTPLHVLGFATPVVGGTGALRHVVIYRCPRCGAKHVSHGRGELPAVLERRGPHGPVVVHIVDASSVAA